MKILDIENPFGAPVYHAETITSTSDAARQLAARAPREKSARHGTVITADFQEAGRGRQSRPWTAARGKNLLFTILLRYGDYSSIPAALTLKTGLAVSLALTDTFPALGFSPEHAVTVKWPNDIMLGAKKIVGILTEADGDTVYIGVGVNVAQQEFPEEYRAKIGSIIQIVPDLAGFTEEGARFTLLEKILARLYAEIETPPANNASGREVATGSSAARSGAAASWHERLTSRLYKLGETVTFAEGAAASTSIIEGTLSGIGPGGELLIIPAGEENARAFITGELRVY